ncbi:phage tail protein [Pantoea sp. GbtcB22]|uniref:phage tail protein n=1 Tax=Pantoea sp. GbtcB22 TaxID=2824767 RepID=UPI001C2FC3FA|nr:phage tail protein [Pantoea sp. GbtcB22]
MDRQIIYPGSIPLETDLLNTNKYAMVGLAKLAAAMMGTTTYLRGLTCTPSSPASMVINIARGEIYSVQNVDSTAYSSLAADTTNTILKQGIVLSSTAFTLTAPTTAGQSINYLIQVAYSDTDSGATVLPYYNAANPSVAYSGPNNSGAAQNTVRSGVCTVALKAGVAATTGTQTTPSVDTGFTAAWVITVAQGATTVTAANMSVAPNAPFLPVGGLVAAIQQNTMSYAADTGAANAYAAQFVPSIPTLTDGMRFTFKAKVANSGASTFSANGGSAYPLYSHAHQALQGGEIVANGLIEVEWSSTLTAWVMCGNSGGALPVAAATQSNHALQLGQAVGRLLNTTIFTSSGTFTPRTDTKLIRVRGVGNGANGAGTAATSSSQAAACGGGGAGGFVEAIFTSGFSGPITVTIGAAQSATSTSGTDANACSFGSLISIPGAKGGLYSLQPSSVAYYEAGGGDGSTPTVSGAAFSIISKGQSGWNGKLLSNFCSSGVGGSGQLGCGGIGYVRTASGSVPGGPAGGYGAGGGGASASISSSAALGGLATLGIFIVEEFA